MEYPIRINKYIRDKGLASRREADSLVEAGLVFVNNQKVQSGYMVKEGDAVVVKKGNVKNLRYIAYYKPRGLATQSLKGAPSVITDWAREGLYPIGRLDKESEGLLILTNDGRLTDKVLGKDSNFEKEYNVKVKEPLRDGIPAIFRSGMKTESLGQLLPAEATIVDRGTLKVILHEGKRHQIRVMLDELHYTITSLRRVRIGHIKLGSMQAGESRSLTPKEIAGFNLIKN